MSVSRFLQALPDVDRANAEDMETALLSMFEAMPEEDLDTQAKQLNRQGVARFTGSVSTGRQWGIIRPTQAWQQTLKRKAAALDDKPEIESPRKVKQGGDEPKAGALDSTQGTGKDMSLGLTRRMYEATGDSSELAKLLEFTRQNTLPSTQIRNAADFNRCVARVKIWDEALSGACSPWRGAPGYVHAFVRRKIVLGELWVTPVESRGINWADVPMESIKLMSPDVRQVLDAFPASWSAEHVSLFCFDRSDWAIFVAMFGCLFGEVADRVKAEPHQLIGLLESEAFGQAAKAHYEKHGIASHPYLLVQSFGPPDKWPGTDKPR